MAIMRVQHSYVFEPNHELSNEENFERLRGMILRILENNRDWKITLLAAEAQPQGEMDPLEFNDLMTEALKVADKIDQDPEMKEKLGL